MNTRYLVLSWLLATVSLTADPDHLFSAEPGLRFDSTAGYEVLYEYTLLASALHLDAFEASRDFEEQMAAFLAEPTEESLAAVKQAWIDARQPYGRIEVFRFIDSPIDSMRLETRMNAWPIDEALIDYVEGQPESGMINQPGKYPEINWKLLGRLNERGGETNITLGWHAIEFLLWGQDFNDDGPGRRPLSDFTTHPHAERRKLYLEVATDVLKTNLGALFPAWEAERYDNYPADLLIDRLSRSLSKAFNGLRRLAGTELASERMFVAYRSRSQEDEHSCFSDTTHLDLKANIEGIEIIYTGQYTSRTGEVFSGPGLKGAVELVKPELAQQIENQIASAKKAILALPAPFDQIITAPADAESRRLLDQAIKQTWQVSYGLGDAVAALGLNN